ncbi:hypothetical protein [Streptomyces globisporus]|uniref:hypothetical protein n=1 Tax=Streptomyces globisporus TaxID=1908 RepID=UPI000F4EEC51|nr:hypothetical protein [Streptomyces globisporus]
METAAYPTPEVLVARLVRTAGIALRPGLPASEEFLRDLAGRVGLDGIDLLVIAGLPLPRHWTWKAPRVYGSRCWSSTRCPSSPTTGSACVYEPGRWRSDHVPPGRCSGPLGRPARRGSARSWCTCSLCAT